VIVPVNVPIIIFVDVDASPLTSWYRMVWYLICWKNTSYTDNINTVS